MRFSKLTRASVFKNRGFSFLEIMLVVAIIGIMIAVVGPKLAGRVGKTQILATKDQIERIKLALGMYEFDQGGFPTTEQGLAALITRPSDVSEETWTQYMEALPLDGWKHEFKYTCPGEDGRDYDLISSGKDDRFDTDDDIANFKKEKTK